MDVVHTYRILALSIIMNVYIYMYQASHSQWLRYNYCAHVLLYRKETRMDSFWFVFLFSFIYLFFFSFCSVFVVVPINFVLVPRVFR